jgi:hypothetical protein
MIRSKSLPVILAALSLLFAAASAELALAQSELDFWQLLALDKVAFRQKPMALLPVTDEPGQTLIYGDRYGYARAIHMDGSRSSEIWRSRILDGVVYEILVEDLEGDGRVEIIVRTQGGRLYVFDEQFNERWQNLEEDYSEISAMTIANMDDDPAYEFVLLADGKIDYVDGQDHDRQFRSTQSYRATEILVGNVDSDASLEIVLNTGTVLDAVLGEPDWVTEPFGILIDLLDIDGDGLDEIIGFNLGQNLRIFDVDEQQEKPLQ